MTIKCADFNHLGTIRKLESTHASLMTNAMEYQRNIDLNGINTCHLQY